MKHMMAMLGANDRAQAFAITLHCGLVQSDSPKSPDSPPFGSGLEIFRWLEEIKHKPTMTWRINRLVIREDRVILRISGRIAGQDVNMLRNLLEEERSPVVIDLKDVLLVDREAVQFLAVRESNGDKLRNCPAYIREWVTKESDTNAAE